MEKYGVATEEEKIKTASTEKKCPKCSRSLSEAEANVPHCPVCGTEPFEKKPEGQP